MNNKGQSVLAEYMTIFFVVIAAATAITIFVQRSLEARIHDARNYMIHSVAQECAPGSNCQVATGTIGYEYEPYYAQTNSFQYQNEDNNSALTNSSSNAIRDVYYSRTNSTTQTFSNSQQLPSMCANGGC